MPRASLTKLEACVNQSGPENVDTSGLRSSAYVFASQTDANVDALVVISGHHPRPSPPTQILVSGRRPVISRTFANVSIDAYVIHRNGVAPRRGAVVALTRSVKRIVEGCAATATRRA
jgi:hypothetical protein